MNQPFDFLEYKLIFRYLFIITLALLAGWVGKDATAILIVSTILYYCLKGKLFEAVISWLIWFFIQGFYLGQGFLTSSFISKYFSKPSFILLIIFLSFLATIPKQLRQGFFLKVWQLFLFVCLLGSLYHGQLPFILITISSFFMLYMLLCTNNISRSQYRQLLNFFVAVALLQTAVSILQVLQYIPPASIKMSDGFGGVDLWEAKLDDAASGTFGPDTSHLVSWYATMIGLFTIFTWAVTQKTKYLIVSGISFLQFATVDSKTVMIVMSMMMGYVLYNINKNRLSFKLTAKRAFSMFAVIILGGMLLITIWNFYYEYSADKYGNGDRGDLNSLLQGEVKASVGTIATHWTEWGKLQGFRYLLEDFKNNPPEIIFGYGLQGYDYNGKMKYIESKDTPVMQLDDSTRSRSGLISSFAKCGMFGFILLFLSIIEWHRHIRKVRGSGAGNLVFISILNIFSIFSLVVSFLYAFEMTSISIIAFGGFVAVLKNYFASSSISISHANTLAISK